MAGLEWPTAILGIICAVFGVFPGLVALVLATYHDCAKAGYGGNLTIAVVNFCFVIIAVFAASVAVRDAARQRYP